MRLVDANVLLYAVNEDAVHHSAARRWLDDALNGSEALALPWISLLAFLRLSTRAGVFPRPLPLAEAGSIVEAWLRRPPVITPDPGPRHLAVLAGLLRSAGDAGNLVNDAHLAALAIEHGAVLVSFDRDFGRFEGLRWEVPEGPPA